MADRQKAVPENVPGAFFVDATCIDCGTCQHLAPETFKDAGETAYVHWQPATADAVRQAARALVSCPTGSIGADAADVPETRAVMRDFPLPVADGVHYCGFTSPKSYGASSYFIRHPAGNWLVDSPKFLPHLVQAFKQAGGVHTIFLSHSDDVAEAGRYAAEFGARRVIHAEEAWSQPGAEVVLEGLDPVALAPDFTAIPVPGHTPGSCCLLYKNQFLFSGDHLWWDLEDRRLANPTSIYWNRAKMAESNRVLQRYRFEWVLPGHGAPVHLDAAVMAKALADLAA